MRTDDPTLAIDSWIRSGLPGRDAAERRLRLIKRLAAHIRSARGEYCELWSNRRFSETDLFRAAFSLEVTAWQANPLDDMTLLVTSGSLRGNEVRELARVWPTALDALRVLGDDGVRCAREIVEEWTVRLLIREEHPETHPAAMEEAPRMLQDVIELADGAPGVVMWAHRLVRRRNMVAELPGTAEGIEHSGAFSSWRYSELLKAAITAMTVEDRRDLILAIPALADRKLFGNLVGTDPDLYRALLERTVPETTHLEPLCGEPSERMIQMARELGYSIPGDG